MEVFEGGGEGGVVVAQVEAFEVELGHLAHAVALIVRNKVHHRFLDA